MMPMTELAIYQNAAQNLCLIRKQDPFEVVGYPHPEGKAVALRALRWVLAAQELQNFRHMHDVLRTHNIMGL